MNLITYLKERAVFFSLNGILFVVSLILMRVFNVNWGVSILLGSIWFIPLLSYIGLEYIKIKRYYKEVQEVFENLEQKYLLCEVIKEPEFIEGKIFYDILKRTHKTMHEQVNEYEGMQLEYKEYIESWIHEIKTPIAAVNLIIENNQDATTQKIADEVRQIEGYIEETLYYARSNDVHKDYIIKPFSLREVVMSTIQKNTRFLIYKRITPQIGKLEEIVYSDYKWISFILNQIISNSIKYTQNEKGVLKIDSERNNHNVILSIEDNGLGIDEKDIDRVFDKGFTGEKGRKFIKSTGIGLYLCKKLCNKLGIGLTIESKLGEGTKVKLIFPVGESAKLREK